jgi:hypothetical protein
MSCWCDGDDPGCEVCHRHLTNRQRIAVRATKAAREALLVGVEKGASGDNLRWLAEAYRIVCYEQRNAFAGKESFLP